jgi:hypothetical protein
LPKLPDRGLFITRDRKRRTSFVRCSAGQRVGDDHSLPAPLAVEDMDRFLAAAALTYRVEWT